MFRVTLLAMIVVASGCATNGSAEVGSANWHELRIAEIEAAYQGGEIEVEDYLLLKNDADQIRMDFRSMIRTYPIRPNVVTYVPIPIRGR